MLAICLAPGPSLPAAALPATTLLLSHVGRALSTHRPSSTPKVTDARRGASR